MLVVALRNIKLGTDIVCCCKIAPVPALVPMGSPPCPCHLCPWGVLGSCRSDKQRPSGLSSGPVQVCGPLLGCQQHFGIAGARG